MGFWTLGRHKPTERVRQIHRLALVCEHVNHVRIDLVTMTATEVIHIVAVHTKTAYFIGTLFLQCAVLLLRQMSNMEFQGVSIGFLGVRERSITGRIDTIKLVHPSSGRPSLISRTSMITVVRGLALCTISSSRILSDDRVRVRGGSVGRVRWRLECLCTLVIVASHLLPLSFRHTASLMVLWVLS